MPHVELTADAPEGGPGNVVSVSRTRAQDLVNAGLARRVLTETRAAPVASTTKRARRPH